ncbi:Glutaminase A {ECO:0000303/PubMed:10952006} {ECO:0000269/PubMed:10952006}; Flags: Precursor [Serendipita indica DSM 11827]|nr:Glutaminase A {ECO:0000303/PubMed:10952006} {ECO:0000269/PubMed:10952006}; Flags: Precursor [Serendipita indica DSM 11827]
MSRWSWSATLLAISTTLLFSEYSSALSYNPIAVPIAVKTPYLNTWFTGGRGSAGQMGRNWEVSGGNGGITAWQGFARVDNTTYSFMGGASAAGAWIGNAATPRSLEVTASQTVYTFSCGGIDIEARFLNPIEPQDLTRTSLPFSYLAVTATPNDGRTHNVQIYADVSGEWLSDSTTDNMTWSTQTTEKIVYHRAQLTTRVPYGVSDNRIRDGQLFYGMLLDTGVTYQTASDTVLRLGFQSGGRLNGTADTNPRAIGDNWPCLALSRDFGDISSTAGPVVFGIGLTRDQAVSYTTRSGQKQDRSLYYRSVFTSDADALSFFLTDFTNSLASANGFDNKLSAAASQISGTYSDLAIMAARQTFANMELTVSTGSDGKLNTTDTLAFLGLKGVNNMEEIYASAPFWIYANPALLRAMLLPIIDYHRRSSDKPYVTDDIGDVYPVATGPSSSALRPKALESTGNMLIVTAALIRVTGDMSLFSDNADLYKTWADYLKDNALYPGQQQTTDGETIGFPTNDTNLALKAIIALKAYADILTSMGEDAKPTRMPLATTRRNGKNWPRHRMRLAEKYGMPLSSETTTTSPHWMVWAAALVPDVQTRDAILSKVQYYLQNGADSLPWPSTYSSTMGNRTSTGGSNRPDIGGVYALLVKDLASVQSGGSPHASSAFRMFIPSSLVFSLFALVVLALRGV